MPHDAVDTVRTFHQLAWSAGDLRTARTLLSDVLVDHNPLAFPGRLAGADGLLQVVAAIRSAFPDLQRTVEQQLCDGDRVVTCFTDRGTHTGELLGIPPTGTSIAVFGINVETVRDGRIAELWHAEDLLGLMRSLGAAPA